MVGRRPAEAASRQMLLANPRAAAAGSGHPIPTRYVQAANDGAPLIGFLARGVGRHQATRGAGSREAGRRRCREGGGACQQELRDAGEMMQPGGCSEEWRGGGTTRAARAAGACLRPPGAARAAAAAQAWLPRPPLAARPCLQLGTPWLCLGSSGWAAEAWELPRTCCWRLRG
jgi:hypothetical protein